MASRPSQIGKKVKSHTSLRHERTRQYTPSTTKRNVILATVLAMLAIAVFSFIAADGSEPEPVKQKPVLTVTAIVPQMMDWPIELSANGNIAAWQEASVGTELSDLRIAEVLVNVGDEVQQGQVLARLSDDLLRAEVAQQKAAVAEARAALYEAQSNAKRARLLAHSDALSAQQINQYVAAERSAQARFVSAHSRLDTEQIRLDQTRVVAPDDGVISASSAVVGAVAQSGQELFKLIRKNRLEWRAEVTSDELVHIKEGQSVILTTSNGTTAEGEVRTISPTINPQTRNALVYVDLKPNPAVRAGMFATGEFKLGRSSALTVPHSSVVTRDGFTYVFGLKKDNVVKQIKVTAGRRFDDRIEIIGDITQNTKIIGLGAGFLTDGDTVRVVDMPIKPLSRPSPHPSTAS